MQDEMIRGYAVPLGARYILEYPPLRDALTPELLSELNDIVASKPDIWVPRKEMIRVWSIVADVSPDDESAYLNLVRGGETVAQQAISTFLKLLLRVLSPRLFARKFPDIWAHEHRGGYVEAVQETENTMVIQIHEVETFPHVGPVAVGFVGTALRALGLKDLKIRDVTWRRDKPNPRDVRIEISWS